MSPHAIPSGADPARRIDAESIAVFVNGEPVRAIRGQSIAAALLAYGMTAWRADPTTGRARGVFCGIGVCFDCLVTVNDVPNVRACLRRAHPGDRIEVDQCVS